MILIFLLVFIIACNISKNMIKIFPKTSINVSRFYIYIYMHTYIIFFFTISGIYSNLEHLVLFFLFQKKIHSINIIILILEWKHHMKSFIQQVVFCSFFENENIMLIQNFFKMCYIYILKDLIKVVRDENTCMNLRVKSG